MKKILLVEDDPRDVELTLAALEEHNLASKVAVVCDGEKALDYLYCRGEFSAGAGGNPILVLLDLKMPKVNGLEVLKIIKADESLKVIPVVMLSSSRETPDVAECYQHGVNAYVVKPVNFTELLKTVHQLGIFWAVINEPPPHPARTFHTTLETPTDFGRREEADHLRSPFHPPPHVGGYEGCEKSGPCERRNFDSKRWGEFPRKGKVAK